MATIIRFPAASLVVVDVDTEDTDTEDVDTLGVSGGHDYCPRCGAVNGVFERLGSGVCNACLSKPRRVYKQTPPSAMKSGTARRSRRARGERRTAHERQQDALWQRQWRVREQW